MDFGGSGFDRRLPPRCEAHRVGHWSGPVSGGEVGRPFWFGGPKLYMLCGLVVTGARAEPADAVEVPAVGENDAVEKEARLLPGLHYPKKKKELGQHVFFLD